MAARAVALARFDTDAAAGNCGSLISGAGTTERCARPGKATVLAIGRAVPGVVVKQEGMAERYLRDVHRDDDPILLAKLQRLCTNTTVKTRYTVLTEKMLKENPGFLIEGASTVKQRLEISADAVTKLGVEAAKKAMEEWGRPAGDITHLVYVSSSEVRLPGGDLHIAINLGLRNDVNRVMLYMLGCCGGAAGIRVAKDLAENNPGSRVLLTTSETCLIGYRAPHPDRPYDLVGAALFGDGAAAMIIGADPIPVVETPFFEFHWAGQSFIPQTERTIEGTLTEEGIIFTLGRELPKLIEHNIDEFARGLLKKIGLDLKYEDLFWAVHPGGPAILNAVEKQLNLPRDKLLCSRQVLSDYGNINSNTIIYVLDYMRKASLQKRKDLQCGLSTDEDPEWGFMLAFGPGVTIEGMVARNLV
ncbi:protein MpPKS/CHS1 [Marchantia polymorpha subsp. ruderalis]|uniref:Chalcone synthase n=2 Tax=Marchantia polymorpha TaxID=3197 RepID=A0A176VDH0_MARPO|nr:hypothetical protein AXG93_3426s1250 [Marchantia polymorpha subsp. ruderalis]PTQ45597.1 hypothetical protein MARPO_0014s0122 [Marchantia polymorpha]BBM98126.1 hypothetical protein Mp_1g11030 [Marchantia polymorpha subsp. ruderalis]|eukprot:PTQ45597.1 hypothetical protein MARPO_0014s0122 [Marchantia polymorpha]